MSGADVAARYRLEVVKGKDAGAVLEGGPEAPVTIGRKLDNVLALQKDLTVSRHHAVIEPTSRGYRIRDVGSQAGIKRRGQKNPPDGVVLADGDEIELGTTIIRFVQLLKTEVSRSEEPSRTDGTRYEPPPPGPDQAPGVPPPRPPTGRRRATPPPAEPASSGSERPGHASADIGLAVEPTIESFGRFAVKKALGGGRDDRSDIAIDTRTGGTVLLRRVAASSLGFFGRRRFLRACEEASGLEHPNLSVPKEHGREGEYVYVVLPAAGLTGESLLRDCPRELTLELITFIGREVSRALAYLETKRGPGFRAEVVPRAVSLSGRGEIRLGIGAPAGIDPRDDVAGRFRAPEEDGGQPGDRRSAIFSVGVLLYELLARGPIEPGHKASLCSVDTVRIDVPAGLAEIVMRAVEARSDDRYDGPVQLEEALAEELAGLAPAYGPAEAAAWVMRHFPDVARC